MDNSEISNTMLAASIRILTPLVKLLLRYGITYAAFSEMSKKIFYEVAKNEFAIAGKKQTHSRISTITGLSRKEVARIESLPEKTNELNTMGINRAARVISGWVKDSDFLSADGEPTDLAFEGGNNSFSHLVKRYSGDITARTIADELSRVDAITTTGNGLIKLNKRAYVASASDQEKLTILGADVCDLIKTIDHNIHNPQQLHFQRKVSYNYIPSKQLPQLKQELSRISQSSLESMDKVLSKHQVTDKEKNEAGMYLRLGVGIYYFEGEQK